MLDAVISFCSAALNGEEPRWLSFLGPSGVGKTHLMRQVLKFLKTHWWLQVRNVWPDGSKSGRTRQFAHIIPAKDLDTYQAAKDYAQNFDLIYIEDIGSGAGEKGSGAVVSGRVAELMQLRSRRWTLCDANMSREQIADRLDPRIASRLRRDNSLCIEITDNVPDFCER